MSSSIKNGIKNKCSLAPTRLFKLFFKMCYCMLNLKALQNKVCQTSFGSYGNKTLITDFFKVFLGLNTKISHFFLSTFHNPSPTITSFHIPI